MFLKILDHDMSTTSSYAAFHDSKAPQTFHLNDNQYGLIEFLIISIILGDRYWNELDISLISLTIYVNLFCL